MSNTTETQLPSPGVQDDHAQPRSRLPCDTESHTENTLFTDGKSYCQNRNVKPWGTASSTPSL